MHTITLIHTFDAAHRVVGHEGGRGKCARLHGHTYKVLIEVGAEELTSEGFVVDFAVLKAFVNEWDHRTILWSKDPLILMEQHDDHTQRAASGHIYRVPFNPTSENMAKYLAEVILASDRRLLMVDVTLSETPKSSANYMVTA